jgi:hypothetical protein
MELNISELNDTIYEDEIDNYNNEPIQSSFEQIPENSVPIKLIKKRVQFSDNVISRHHSKISYEDILTKMGMLVLDGKLHLVDRNTLTPKNQQPNQLQEQVINVNMPQNRYIYNKYFKDDLQSLNTTTRPRTFKEYKRMLIVNEIQRQRIKQIKSTKLIMPTANINISSGGNSSNLNKLFSFSKR